MVLFFVSDWHIIFLLAIEVGKWMARKSKVVNPDVLVNAGLIALVTGILGARLSHVLENWPTYSNPARSFAANLFDAINISSGGLTFYGGLILATPITIWYALSKKTPLRTGMDISAVCILIGLGFGRVGCFLNGCCYGAQSNLPWAVHFPYHSPAYLDEAEQTNFAGVPDALVLKFPDGRKEALAVEDLKLTEAIYPSLSSGDMEEATRKLVHEGGVFRNTEYRGAFIAHAREYGGQDLVALAHQQHSAGLHPAQLYSAFNALLLAAFLVAYFTLRHAPGRGFALMLILEGATRYLLEMLRVEPPVLYMHGIGFSLSMVIGFCLVIGGIILWFVFGAMDQMAAAEATVAIPA